MISIGYGHLDAVELINRLYPQEDSELTLQQLAEATTLDSQSTPSGHVKTKATGGILVGNMDNILVTMARCCSPVPGDDIIGFITRGKGVTIHRSNCQSSLDLDPMRRIDVSWQQGEQIGFHLVCIRIETQDRQGILAEVTTAISSTGANIQKANINISKDLIGVLDFEITVKGIDHLRLALSRIEGLTGVISVQRVNLDQVAQPKVKKKKNKS